MLYKRLIPDTRFAIVDRLCRVKHASTMKPLVPTARGRLSPSATTTSLATKPSILVQAGNRRRPRATQAERTSNQFRAVLTVLSNPVGQNTASNAKSSAPILQFANALTLLRKGRMLCTKTRLKCRTKIGVLDSRVDWTRPSTCVILRPSSPPSELFEGERLVEATANTRLIPKAAGVRTRHPLRRQVPYRRLVLLEM